MSTFAAAPALCPAQSGSEVLFVAMSRSGHALERQEVLHQPTRSVSFEEAIRAAGAAPISKLEGKGERYVHIPSAGLLCAAVCARGAQ